MNLIVLDYNDGYVYHYKITDDKELDIELYISEQGHKLSDVHYMCTSASEYNLYISQK